MPRAQSTIRTIGVLTGGGDCPGLNAVIRAVSKTAMFQHSLRVLGIEDGFLGMVQNRVRELSETDVSGILTRGGTILGTNNRCNPTRVHVGVDASGNHQFVSRVSECLQTIATNRIDALILIGGDGTMTCAKPFLDAGIPCIGVPKTIDNDIVGTDLTFGFTTAMTTATESLDRLHDTADSHHRVMVCEVMGRNAGWLALHSGIASGSEVILIPEIPYALESISRAVEARRGRHKGFSIVVVAEGARSRDGTQVVTRRDPTSPDPVRLGGIGERVGAAIEQATGMDTRVAVLGHVVRGGTPAAADRVLATQFGFRAVELLMSGHAGRMVVMREGSLHDIDMREVIDRQRLVPLDHDLIKAGRALKTCFGD